MPAARLSVQIPEDIWIHDVSRRRPDATFRVLTTHHDTAAIAILAVIADDPLGILTTVRTQEDVPTLDLVSADDRQAIVHLETAETGLLDLVASVGVPLSTPFVVEDGVVNWDLTTTDERLSKLAETLDAADLEYRVQHVGEAGTDPHAEVLTDRQRELLSIARDRGFFSIPRDSTVSEIADEMGITKSTASDLLRRAQRNVVEWYFERPDTHEP
ncbi:MAG: helix-turn-helix domain-containing protein [Halodesulfurarchaeum sp.]